MKTVRQTIAIGLVTALPLAWGIQAEVQAQVVQLPSSRSLNYSGSVSVPDGGTAALGGISGSSYGSNRGGWGPYSSRSSASSAGGSSLSASVQIIDLAALDEAILAGDVSHSADPRRPDSAVTSNSTSSAADSDGSSAMTASAATSRATSQHATYLTDTPSMRIGADPGKWQRVLAGDGDQLGRNPTLLESDIRYYLKQGESAEKSGSLMAARVYYKMARDLMTPELIQRYERIVAQRQLAEEARIKAEVEAVRRRF